MAIGIVNRITDDLRVAMLRSLSSGGSRGFMLDVLHTFGPVSFTSVSYTHLDVYKRQVRQKLLFMLLQFILVR